MQPNSFRLTEGSNSRARSGGTDPERSCPGGPEPSAPVAATSSDNLGAPGQAHPPGSPRLRLPTGLRWFLRVTLLVHPSSTLPCLGAHTWDAGWGASVHSHQGTLGGPHPWQAKVCIGNGSREGQHGGGPTGGLSSHPGSGARGRTQHTAPTTQVSGLGHGTECPTPSRKTLEARAGGDIREIKCERDRIGNKLELKHP